MLAQLRDDVRDLNTRAREQMRAAGRLGNRELRLPGGAFAVGDHVLVKRNDLRLGVVNGDRGRVTAVDPDTRQLTLDLGGEQVTLGPGYLEDRTVHGDPTLQHGYAMTVHVAQGLTVDHAFVLAGPGLNRELGYTAISRGRESNHLYVAREPETARVEYAPTDPYRVDPIARLTAQLATSSETTLAIDTGRPDDRSRSRRRGTRAPRGRRSAPRRGEPRVDAGSRTAGASSKRSVGARPKSDAVLRPFVASRPSNATAISPSSRTASTTADPARWTAASPSVASTAGRRRDLGRGLER